MLRKALIRLAKRCKQPERYVQFGLKILYFLKNTCTKKNKVCYTPIGGNKMKKIILISALLIIPAFSCFAGSFYSNVVVLSVENVVSVLLQMGITAYYIIKNKVTVIFEERIDEQDIGYGIKLTSEISKRLNTMAIYTTNHDSDVLIMYIYKNGQELFFYNSNPDYFEGEDVPSPIKNIDKLLLEYKNINKDELMNILTTDEIFADTIHMKIAEKLELPEYSVGYGFNFYANMDKEEIEGMENGYKIKIEKVEK
ncbi:hypothetical protein PilKf_02357 [Pillotina sp. SPG140]